MAFPNVVRSSPEGVPLSQSYVPSIGQIALKGSPNTIADASGTVTAAAVMLDQSEVLTAILQTAQNTNGNGASLAMAGMGALLFEVTMAAFTGTVNFEGAGANANYDQFFVNQLGTNTVALTVVGAVTTSTHLYELANASGLAFVRARTSGVSAGTVTITAYAQPLPASPRVIQANITGNSGTVALETGGNLATLVTRTTLGQAASANSRPVVLASDQSNVPISQKPGTAGGSLTFHLIAAGSLNAQAIKASAGQVYGWEIYNANAALRFVKLYNKATAPAPATDTALLKYSIAIPAGQRASYVSNNGLAFSSGIAMVTTNLIADTDVTVVTANDLDINIEYF